MQIFSSNNVNNKKISKNQSEKKEFKPTKKEEKTDKEEANRYLKKEKKNLNESSKEIKNIISSEKKGLNYAKKSLDFIKLNPPSNEYFSIILSPEFTAQLDEKITEGIKYGAQALIIITSMSNSFNNPLYISQVLQSFSESESLLNSYRIIIASVEIDQSDLIQVPLALGMPNPPTNDWCISISACTLPKKPLDKGESYFSYNKTPPLNAPKVLMTNTDIMQGNSTNQTCGKKKNDSCYATNIKLSPDLPNKITQAIQAYVSSIPIYPIEYDSSLAKSAKKGFNQLNQTILDRINTKTAQLKNYNNFSQTVYNEKNTINTTKPKESFLGKATFGVL